MSKLESMKKASKVIGRIGKVCEVLFGMITGLILISTIAVLVLRNTLNVMIAESQQSFDFRNMGYWAQRLSEEGRTAEAFAVFGISTAVLMLVITVIMYYISKIFKRFCNDYSPFLPEAVKDFKIVSLLAVLLVLRNSIGLGIILGFIFWGIIQVYEYGCELQNQADETL